MLNVDGLIGTYKLMRSGMLRQGHAITMRQWDMQKSKQAAPPKVKLGQVAWEVLFVRPDKSKA